MSTAGALHLSTSLKWLAWRQEQRERAILAGPLAETIEAHMDERQAEEFRAWVRKLPEARKAA